MHRPELVDLWIYTGNKLAKFHGNILSQSENFAKSFKGGYFFDSHCTCAEFDICISKF